MSSIRNYNFAEVIGGFSVVLLAIFLLFSSGIYKTGGPKYNIHAQFESVEGIQQGSFVKMSGIAIGRVANIVINPDNFYANLTLSIEENYPVPEDSSAEIVSEGLLGAKYIALLPGGANKALKDSGVIVNTQSSINLERLISKFMFSSSAK